MLTAAQKIEHRKQALKRYYESHREQCRKWGAEWSKNNRNKINKRRRKRYATPEGKAVRDRIEKRYCEKNRIKRLAKDAVHNAVMKGTLKKLPCEQCGNTDKIHGHHPDYNRQLDVIWLCQRCHVDFHKWLKVLAKAFGIDLTQGRHTIDREGP